ncbi:MAG: transcription antitermination factor NusB [Paludibacteraceae bacterium]|nr:transcription antitermination factor NusB [Paludibacteraceae bacterium]MBQ2189480.1 transcription antitermination factor NusB [Paludibacteraceae bacterium]MBQ2520193.1 transcription antitermination factor NusB [Paludibacteraceae bacterium]MBQ4018645.1 transcription antitermination factor NusB [Paludibacteraceae bacterium]MBQ5379025.1 transcription antitermination factor NusB [Paludibacteraceae bacterium]
MINRTMVRTRVIQTLFAYYKDSDKTVTSARNELRKSFADTYDLYFVLLDFVNEMTAYAQVQLEEQTGRARATHSNWKPNKRFVQNRLAQQLFDNRALRARMAEQHLAWDSGMSAVSDVYRRLTESDFYRAYMEADSCTYEDDKRLWRHIYQYLMVNNEALMDALEEMEVVMDKSNWTVDADIIISYVIKTIKRFKADSTPETPLLEMFDNEEELQFAIELMEKTIAGHEQYEQLINTHLKGWDADRIAYMDRIILEVALAEILEFEEIPMTISLNEYIELAKEYSGDKNYMFINGILTEILRDLKNEGTFFKGFAVK